MITDVIDDAEVKNGVREDGTIYSVYSFARKIGQALSSGMIGALLSVIGFVGIALVLMFLYPLSKNRVAANVLELKKRRGEI
ncbi:MAG: MFS transporter [Holdemanella porci]